MKSQDILRSAASTFNERSKQYGDVEFMFDLTANLATMMTGREFSKYDVTVIMEALKLARRRVNPTNPDNYVDAINYMTFSGQFARVGDKVPVGMADQIRIEDDIAEFAKKFAPVQQQESEGA